MNIETVETIVLIVGIPILIVWEIIKIIWFIKMFFDD